MELFPKQEELRSRIEHSIAVRKSFVYEAGMRAGKTELMRAIVRSILERNLQRPVYWVGTTANAARDSAGGLISSEFCLGPNQLRSLLDSPGSDIPDNALFVMDDVFWMDRGEALFKQLTSASPPHLVVAYGSRSDTPWKMDAHILKMSSWEMNPKIDVADLAEQFAQDPKKAERDYGPLPKNG